MPQRGSAAAGGSTPSRGPRPVYGAGFWINGTGMLLVPREAYYMAGAGGQFTLVIPSHDLVVVRMGHYSGSAQGSESSNRALALLTGPRAQSPSDKGLGDVILGAIPYWKTELAINAGCGGPHERAEGLRACPTGASPPRRTLDSVIVAAAISYDRRRAD